MTEKEKMLNGFLYDTSDGELVHQRDMARDASERFNRTMESEKEKRLKILKGLLGGIGEDTEVFPTVKFDYGCNTFIGSGCYINFNAVFLDCAQIRLGNNVFVGPNVSFLTPIHLLLARERNLRTAADGHKYMMEYCLPITVEDNVWMGGSVTVMPGVTIGHDSVIGAGSVVTKDIPSGVIAVGNPCRVLRKITEADSVEGHGTAFGILRE